MSRALRSFWLLLIMVAVPLQGVAAVTMAACGPAHRAVAAHAAHASHGGHADMSAHSNAAAGDHAATAGHAHAGPIDDAAPSATAHPDQAPTDGTPVAKCSVCASCCTATALPTQAVVSAPVALTEFLVAFEPGAAAAFLTQGPERPPRSFLA